MSMRPILLNSCAKAATASETRFRIDAPIAGQRAARIVALDEGAGVVVRRVAEQHWSGARFFTGVDRTPQFDDNGESTDVALRATDGSQSRLCEQLAGADLVVMIATAEDGAKAASAIGDACTQRGIMTAGLVLGERREVGAAVSALRPHARVLMVTKDEHDVSEVLTALRA
jgi:hypothetical protein